jgi:hypothetical protein
MGTGRLSCATKVCGRLIIHTLCLTKDGGRPSEVTIQTEASNHRKLLRSKAMVVSVTEKGETRFRQVRVNGDEQN